MSQRLTQRAFKTQNAPRAAESVRILPPRMGAKARREIFDFPSKVLQLNAHNHRNCELEVNVFVKVGYPFREEKSFIDRDALREAVINAFVHNDYSDLMCPAFYIFSDRIEIVSYGGLIDGMSKEELISGCSRPRNRELMRIFRDVDLVEQLGTGMEKMMAVFTPKIFELTPNFFHAVLRPEYTTEEDTAC